MICESSVRLIEDVTAEHVVATQSAPRRALFLDRDGVINEDRGYVHTPAETFWIPGIFDLVRGASTRGFLCIVVTNQAGVARGYYDESVLCSYTRWMHDRFRAAHAPLVATYYCPHHPDTITGSCFCRKPEPGMLLAAANRFGVDMSGSWLVGDKLGDLEAGRRAGVGHLRLVEAGNEQLAAILADLLTSAEP